MSFVGDFRRWEYDRKIKWQKKSMQMFTSPILLRTIKSDLNVQTGQKLAVIIA